MRKRRILAFVMCLAMLFGDASAAMAAQTAPVVTAQTEETTSVTEETTESQPSETQQLETQPAETQPVETQAEEPESPVEESTEAEKTEGETPEGETGVGETAGETAAEEETTEEETTEEGTTEEMTTEEETTEEETTEEDLMGTASILEGAVPDVSEGLAIFAVGTEEWEYASLEDAIAAIDTFLTENAASEAPETIETVMIELRSNQEVSGDLLDRADGLGEGIYFEINLSGNDLLVTGDATIYGWSFDDGVVYGEDGVDEGKLQEAGSIVVSGGKTLQMGKIFHSGESFYETNVWNVGMQFKPGTGVNKEVRADLYLDSVSLGNVRFSGTVGYVELHNDVNIGSQGGALQIKNLTMFGGGRVNFACPVTVENDFTMWNEGSVGIENDFTVQGNVAVKNGNTWLDVQGQFTVGNDVILEKNGEEECARLTINRQYKAQRSSVEEEPVILDGDNMTVFKGNVLFLKDNVSCEEQKYVGGTFRFTRSLVLVDENGEYIENPDEALCQYNYRADDKVAVCESAFSGYTDGMGIDTAEGEEYLFVEKRGEGLYAAAIAVNVQCESGIEVDGTIWYPWKSYGSFELAMENLAADFGSVEAEYTFTFEKDIELTKDSVVPDFVKKLNLMPRGVGHTESSVWVDDYIKHITLDFNGKKITSNSPVSVVKGVTLFDDNDNEGSLIINAYDVRDQYCAFDTWEITTQDGAVIPVQNEAGEVVSEINIVDGIQVNVPNGTVVLPGMQDGIIGFRADALTANRLDVNGGEWIFGDAVTVKEYCVQNDTCVRFQDLTVSVEGYSLPNSMFCVEGTYTVNNGQVNFEMDASAYLGDLVINSGTFVSLGMIDVAGGVTVNGGSLENQAWGTFICDTYTSNAKAGLLLSAGSRFVVNESAVIYGLDIRVNWENGEEVAASFYKMPDAEIAINSVRTSEVPLYFGVLDAGDAVAFRNVGENGFAFVDGVGTELLSNIEDFPVQTMEKAAVLFTTTDKAFPTEIVQVLGDGRYDKVVQKGNDICVAAEWISVYARGMEKETHLKSFVFWQDAAAYINTLSNASVTYIIEFHEDLDIETQLVMPASAAKVEFRGASEAEAGRVELTYRGDLTLTADTAFINMDLKAMSADGSKEYNSIAKLQGKDLELINTNVTLASVTGTADSNFRVLGTTENYVDGQPESKYRPTVTITGTVSKLDTFEIWYAAVRVKGTGIKATAPAISAVENLIIDSDERWQISLGVANGTVNITGNADIRNAVLTTNGAVSIAKTTVMKSGEIGTTGQNSKITLGDVVSLDDMNDLAVAGNEKNNMLVINGNIYGPEMGDRCYGDMNVTYADGKYVASEENVTGTVRKAAINVFVRSMEDATAEQMKDVVLLSAPNVQPEWFVWGSMQNGIERQSFEALAHKEGTNIICGALENQAVVLKRVVEEGQEEISGRYATLQEAFTEIERIANGEDYIIEILRDDEEVFLNAKGQYVDLVTPSKAGYLSIIAPDGPKKLRYKSTLTLKTHMSLGNIELTPSADSKIVLGDYWLEIGGGTSVTTGKKILSVTGSGVAKGSGLSVIGTDGNKEFTIDGSLTNVGGLYLGNATLIVKGTVNIGNIEQAGNSKLLGLATVKRDKDGNVIQIVPSITINGTVRTYDDTNFALGLMEKVDAEYVTLDFDALDEDGSYVAKGIQLAKAINVSSEDAIVSEDNVGVDVNRTLTKSGGYLVYKNDGNELGVIVTYEEEGVGEIVTRFSTFAEAVGEIDGLKTKRDYTIYLDAATADISLEKPAVLVMPKKTNVATLTIVGGNLDGESAEPVSLHYLKNITLTSDVILRNVAFVQVEATNDGDMPYAPVNELQEDCPAAVAVSVAGNKLTINGVVTFNTPITLTGGGKGSLSIIEAGQIYTETNGKIYEEDRMQNAVCGSVSGFAEIVLENKELYVNEFVTYSKGKAKYTAAKFDAVNVTVFGCVDGGGIFVGGDRENTFDTTEASTKVSGTAYMDSGVLYAKGTLSLKNVTFAGDAPCAEATGKFDITGVLTSTADGALLISARNEKNSTPYLNVSGKVMLEDAKENRIYVGVTEKTESGYVPVVALGYGETEAAPGVKAQLLNAKNATADMFIAYEENVDVAAYSPSNTNGYILSKDKKNNVHIYYGDKVEAALCLGDASNGSLSEAIAGDKVLGYYPTYAEAVNALDGRKDKTAEYTILLLQNVGSKTAPVAFTMPKTAAKVTIASGKVVPGDVAKNVYYTGSISLGTATDLVDFGLMPMKKSGSSFVGSASDIKTGANELALRGVTVGKDTVTDAVDSTMTLANINGNGKQTVILDSEGLEISGSITKVDKLIVQTSVDAGTMVAGNVQANEIVLEADATLTQYNLPAGKGFAVTANTLTLSGSSCLDAYGAVTVTDIVNNGAAQNYISYGKNPKGAPNLTVKGMVSGDCSRKLQLRLCDEEATAEDAYVLAVESGKVVLTDAKKLAIIEKAALSDFDIHLYLGATAEDKTLNVTDVVKANKGVYLVDTNSGANKVALMNLDAGETTYCLDMSQAVNDVNNRADGARYGVMLVGDINDTNVTDKNAVSTLAMPKKNVAAGFGIVGGGYTIRFSGNIAYDGVLELQNTVLYGTDAAGALAKDFAVSLKKADAGASLTLTNVTTKKDAEGKTISNLSKISGTKGVTEVVISGGDLTLTDAKASIADIATLKLTDGAKLTTVGGVTLPLFVLCGASSWDAFGVTTITDIDATDFDVDGEVYVASKLAYNKKAKVDQPQFTVSGKVKIGRNNIGIEAPLPIKVLTAEATKDNKQYVEDYLGVAADGASGVGLVVAPLENADRFVAYPYRVLNSTDTAELEAAPVEYKDSYYVVKNANVENMKVSVKEKDIESNRLGETYFDSYDAAVSYIDKKNNPEAIYTITLYEEGTAENPAEIKTGKNGTEYGALKLPSKALEVTIRCVGENSVLSYTGKITPKTNVHFDSVVFNEGTIKNKVFTPTYGVTLDYGKANYYVSFGNSMTIAQPGETDPNLLNCEMVFHSIKGKEGRLYVPARNTVIGDLDLAALEVAHKLIVLQDMNVKDLNLRAVLGETCVTVYGDITVNGTVNTESDETNTLVGKNKITINNMVIDETDTLDIETYLTEDLESQIAINGEVEGNVTLIPMMYNADEDVYDKLTEEHVRNMVITDLTQPMEAFRKVATMPKASGETFALKYKSGTLRTLDGNAVKFYKQDSGLYLTTAETSVMVKAVDSEGNENYNASFASWEQAVAEIDKRGDKNASYEILLAADVNTPVNGGTPTALAMPAQVEKVTVKTADGCDPIGMFFTGHMTLKCDMAFENVGLFAVKKVGKAPNTYYDTATYNITLGTFALEQKAMIRETWNEEGYFANEVATISGKGTSAYTYETREWVEGEEYLGYWKLADKISGVGTVTLKPIEREGVEVPGGITATTLHVEGGWCGTGDVSVTTLNMYNNSNMSTGKVTVKGTANIGTASGNWCDLSCDGDFSAKDLYLEKANVSAKNLKLTGTTSFSNASVNATMSNSGDGKVTLKDVMLNGNENYVGVKQDKKGVSQLEISGTVQSVDGNEAFHDSICVGIYYNNSRDKYAQLYEGMKILNAPKADSSWFGVAYDNTYMDENGEEVYAEQMGQWMEGYEIYKSGKEIRYGKMENMEVLLQECDSDNGYVVSESWYETFEEAVKAIDAKGDSDATYEIRLSKDVEIGNEKGDGKYKALSLPVKAGYVKILGDGHTLSFSGKITLKCDMGWYGLGLQPRKSVKGGAELTKTDINIGKFILECTDVWAYDEERGTSLFGAITGTKEGRLLLGGHTLAENGYLTVLQHAYHMGVDKISGLGSVILFNSNVLAINGDCTVENIRFRGYEDAEGKSGSVLMLGGNLTVDSIIKNGDASATAFISKLPEKTMKVNAEMLSLNESDVSGIEIRVQAPNCESGLKVMSGNGVNEKLIHVRDYFGEYLEGVEYTTYMEGTDIYVGEPK